MPYYTYILTNSLSTVLYIGVTNSLEARLLQHRRKETPGFTSRYNVNKLVYYETFDYVLDAIAREKQPAQGLAQSEEGVARRNREQRMAGPERRLVSMNPRVASANAGRPF